MFCYQCQETANNSGCKLAGVCGKKPELSNALDLLVYIVKGIGVTYNLCKEKGLLCPDVEKVYNFVNDALFCSITNANFDIESVYRRIDEGILLRNSLIRSIKDKGLGIPDIEQARRPAYTTGGAERSGMGFTIMESFMTDLEITSKPGKGTTVHMRRKLQRRQ